MTRPGNRVSLLTGTAEGTKVRYKYEGVEIHRTPIMDLNWLYKRGLERIKDEVYGVFSSFIKEVRPHVIHAHNMHYFSINITNDDCIWCWGDFFRASTGRKS